MSIRKHIWRGFGAVLAAGALLIASQTIELSMPRSLGYRSASITGMEFDAGRFSASSYITVSFDDQSQAKIPVDASFSPPKIGQPVCIHSSTRWLTVDLSYRFAQSRKCTT